MRFAKLVMDLPDVIRLRGHMDNDRLELAIALCNQVGMAMEDLSVVALMPDRAGEGFRVQLDALANSIAGMDTLIAAARVLANHSDP